MESLGIIHKARVSLKVLALHATLPPSPDRPHVSTDEESFKVTDRRGRGEQPARPEPAPSPSLPPAAAGGPRPSPPPGAGTRAGGEPSKLGVATDLGGIFVMFAGSALINLGEAADPMTGERRVDLAQAQGAIDMLLTLRDKTRGNRTEQESRLLEDILYDLQMRFVRAARSGARPSAS